MKDNKVFIGIDIGTSVTKGVVLDLEGNILSSHKIDRITNSELDLAEIWWNEAYMIIQKLLCNGDIKSNLYSITISGMCPNLVMLDEYGNCIIPSRLFHDNFAIEMQDKLDKEDGTKWMNEYLSKLIYLKENEKEWYKVKHILTTHTYCIYKLTGKIICDFGTAIECGHAFNITEKEWDSARLNQYCINAELFPEIVSSTNVVGNICDVWEKELGISDVKIIAGSHDSVATIIGAGLSQKKDSLIYYGTYNCAAFLDDDIKNLLNATTVVNPIKWTVSIPRSGQHLQKIVEILCGENNYKQFFELASKAPQGSNGTIFIQNSKLLKSGISSEPNGQLHNISLATTKNDICRSVLEAFGFGILSFWKYESTEKPKECYAAGGGTQNTTWVQIVSDIIGVNQILLNAVENSVGTAMIGICSYNQAQFDSIRNNRIKNATIISHSGSNQFYEAQFNKYYNILIENEKL